MGLGMLGGMAAALGAGADGYNAGVDRGRKLKQEDEDRAFQADQRARMKEQQDREKQVRDAIDKASKDFTVEPVSGEAKPASMDNRDVGAAGEQALQPGGYRAGSMTYATQGEAQAAATASAAPAARMDRVAGAMERNGDAVGGMKMRNVMQQQKVGDLQLKAGELQLKQGERKEANDAWDDHSKTALLKGGPDGFAQFLSDSKGDNQDGAAKFKATRSPDGKTWRIDLVGPNGELIPRTQEFTNDARGFAEAHVLFSMGVPETQKLAHYVAQQNADTQAGYRKDQADNMREQRRIQELGIGMRDVASNMSEADKAMLGDINKRREHISSEIVKAKASGMWREDDPNAKSLIADLASLGLQASGITARYGDAGGAPDPLGLRGGGGGGGGADAPAPATRAPTKEEAIQQDMRRTGVGKANAQLNQAPLVSMTQAGAIGAPLGGAKLGAKPAAASAPTGDSDGSALDGAKTRYATATAALQKFGSRQRQADPKGFEAALAAQQVAKAELDAAQQAYAAAASPNQDKAAFVYPKP